VICLYQMKARIKELLFSGLTLKNKAGNFLFFLSLICLWIEPGISVGGISSVL
jgi:hypothetical protein